VTEVLAAGATCLFVLHYLTVGRVRGLAALDSVFVVMQWIMTVGTLVLLTTEDPLNRRRLAHLGRRVQQGHGGCRPRQQREERGMKVLSVVGARPQFVKLAPMAAALTAAGHDQMTVHTGQHYDINMSDSFFTELGTPTPEIHLEVGSGTHGRQTGAILSRMDEVLEQSSPDWVLVYGDTNSTLAGACAAVKMHIPLAHLEAGLRSFNRQMPEEHNRVATDHLADVCLAPTEVAMGHLAAEGLAPRSHLVGDVMTDVLYQVRDSVSGVEGDLGAGDGLVLATLHRPSNTDGAGRLRRIIEALQGLDGRVVLAAHRGCGPRPASTGSISPVGRSSWSTPCPIPTSSGPSSRPAPWSPTQVDSRRRRSSSGCRAPR